MKCYFLLCKQNIGWKLWTIATRKNDIWEWSFSSTSLKLPVAANKPCQTRKTLLCQDDLCKYWQYTCQAQSGNPAQKGNCWVQVSHEKCHMRFLSATVVPAFARCYVSTHCGNYVRHVDCLKHMNSQIVAVYSISFCCQKCGSWLVSSHCWHEEE